MLDIELAAALVEAIPPACRLILVGDADQLPSVGPGNVLADLIRSESIPVVRLDQVFRQAAESMIVVNAHRVNAGDMPKTGLRPRPRRLLLRLPRRPGSGRRPRHRLCRKPDSRPLRARSDPGYPAAGADAPRRARGDAAQRTAPGGPDASRGGSWSWDGGGSGSATR